MNCKKKKKEKKLINRNLTIRRLHWAVLTASAQLHLYEVPRVAKFIETEIEWWVPGAG